MVCCLLLLICFCCCCLVADNADSAGAPVLVVAFAISVVFCFSPMVSATLGGI